MFTRIDIHLCCHLISNAIMIMIWHLDKLLVELTLDNKRLLLSIYLSIMANPC